MTSFIKRIIPNALTCANLVCGCIALVCAFNPFEQYMGMYGYEFCFLFILLGALADFFDGFAARLLNVHSSIGADLDSLADLVTFGLAPAMLIFNLFTASAAADWMQWSALLVPICGALRLARFNVDDTQTIVFRGLPIPSCALFCIGLASVMVSPSGFNPYAATGCTVFIAILMVCPMRMLSLKFKGFGFNGTNILRYILLLIGLVSVSLWQWTGFLVVICAYILISFVYSMFALQQQAADNDKDK